MILLMPEMYTFIDVNSVLQELYFNIDMNVAGLSQTT